MRGNPKAGDDTEPEERRNCEKRNYRNLGDQIRKGGGHKEKMNRWGRNDSMKCLFPNVDSLLSKRSELLSVLGSDPPDAICITEVLPKNLRHAVNLCEKKD